MIVLQGAMVFLGIGNASQHTDVNLHNPRFKMDENQLHLGAALHVEMALSALESLNDPRAAASKLPCSKLHGSEHPSCAEGTAMEAED